MLKQDRTLYRKQFAGRNSGRAFTLIELLIVVAIIAILAAIAVPNFLEAQTRSKVARVKADMRTLVTAIESYRTDANNYPVRRHSGPLAVYEAPEWNKRLEQMKAITTPISYLTSLPADPFETFEPAPNNVIDYYDPEQTADLLNSRVVFFPQLMMKPEQTGYMLVSVGPDRYLGAISNACNCPIPTEQRGLIYVNYDPTNGTTSTGNIYYLSSTGMDGTSQKLTQLFLRQISGL